MAFITDHQLLLLTLTFSAGVIGTALIARHLARLRAWQVADLLWVVLGAIGAVAALMAGVYKTDSTRISHQIDVAYAATNAYDRDAARFRLRYCEGDRGNALHVLCDRVEFLSASTAGNAELPLFIQITKSAAPLQGLRLLPAKVDAAEMDDMDFAEMVAEANAFDPDPFLEFVALDTQTEGALRVGRQRD